MSRTAKVFIEPIGVTVELDGDEPLLTAVTQVGIEVPATCGGRGTCGKCLVRLGAGDLSTPTEEEAKRLSPKLLADGWRLACQAHPLGERVSIEVREAKGRRQILTASRLHHGEVRSPVVREAVRLTPPELGSAGSDDERLRTHLGVKHVPLSVLRTLPDTLRDSDWEAVVTRYGDTLIDVEPDGAAPHVYGAAVDIGTSKIITYLFDLTAGAEVDQEAIENPQMRFGEDVITRVTLAMHEGRLDDLTRAAREGIDETLASLYARQGIEARHLYDMTVVGNTAMHHLALGISPVGLGGAPFAPAVDRPLLLRAAELGIDMNPEGGVYFLPPIAGFVGSD
ncbi:MAG TPA: 2Fe-2S iron-sulfur cluster-binding protein, partial [Thermoleophilia bacterium]|nr:2Fe-2S iron-sulfur cluster-binding protein [Thermoleophilia bacterium]